MPLTHFHLKRVLQIYMQTRNIENNKFQASDYAMLYLLSSIFIEYFALQHNNNDNKEEVSTTSITIATESVSIPNNVHAA